MTSAITRTLTAVAVVCAVSWGAAAPTSAATIIDTTSAAPSSWIQAFGSLDTATYGQTFTVSGPDTVIDSFSLFLHLRAGGSGTLDLRGYLAEWDGSKAGDLLYTSATQTMNAEGDLQEFAFNTGGIELFDGLQYVVFLSISELLPQPQSRFRMPQSESDLDGGAFVFMNHGTNFSSLFTQNWSQGWVGSGDVWFKAEFSNPTPIPAPPAVLLFLSGLGLMGFFGWRRNKQVKAAS